MFLFGDETKSAVRARFAARRVLSLLIYAQSEDLLVPDAAIRSLYDEIYGDGNDGAPRFQWRAIRAGHGGVSDLEVTTFPEVMSWTA